MKGYIVDIHSHLADKYFDGRRDEVVAEMRRRGAITISVGVDEESSRRATAAAAAAHGCVWACVGVHPEEHPQGFSEKAFNAMAALPRTVAVGECGLDYFRAPRNEVRKAQLELLEAQYALARAHALPLMLHVRPSRGSRDAYEDILSFLEARALSEPVAGNVHFFAGGIAEARRFLNLGFTLSFTGVITFVQEYDAVVRFAPLDALHAETDAPFVAPVPYRGRPSEPWMAEEVVRRIAALKGLPFEAVRAALCENALRTFPRLAAALPEGAAE